MKTHTDTNALTHTYLHAHTFYTHARFEQSILSYRKGVEVAERYLGGRHPICITLKNSLVASKKAAAAAAAKSGHGKAGPKKAPGKVGGGHGGGTGGPGVGSKATGASGAKGESGDTGGVSLETPSFSAPPPKF